MTKEVEKTKQETDGLVSRLRQKAAGMSLSAMLIVVISAACCIVLIGYLLYENDSNRKYDIARPGQHDDNQVLTVEDEEADTTGPVTPSVAKQKIENFDKEVNGLGGINSFDPNDLSDQNIQLTPPEQPSL